MVAHLIAVMAGSLILFLGMDTIVFGASGSLSGLGKWVGGLLIIAVLGVVTIPVGLLLRWAIGKLPVAPMTGAFAGGVGLSLVLMFILHPAMYPPLNILSHPIKLTLVHLLAGSVGALMWYLVEFQTRRAVVDG